MALRERNVLQQVSVWGFSCLNRLWAHGARVHPKDVPTSSSLLRRLSTWSRRRVTSTWPTPPSTSTCFHWTSPPSANYRATWRPRPRDRKPGPSVGADAPPRLLFCQGGDKQPHLSQLSHRLDLNPTKTTTQRRWIKDKHIGRCSAIGWCCGGSCGREMSSNGWLVQVFTTLFSLFFWLFFFCLSVQSCGMHPHNPPPSPSCTHMAPAFAKPIPSSSSSSSSSPIMSTLLPEHTTTPPPPLSAGAHFSCVCGGVRMCACEDFPEDMLPLWLLTSPSSNNSRPPLPPPPKKT